MAILALTALCLAFSTPAGAALSGRGPTGNNIPIVSSTESPADTDQTTTQPNNVSGQVLDDRGRPAAQVQVIFKNQDTSQATSIFPGRVSFPQLLLLTDNQGRYQLHLDDGQWLGTACGSKSGYTPLFWEIAIYNNVITSYREMTHTSPTIDSISVNSSPQEKSLRPGTEITVSGNWFGCSGKIVMEVEGVQQEITHFIRQENTLLTFSLPDFADQGMSSITTFALTYVNGANRSRRVAWKMASQPAPGAVITNGGMRGRNNLLSTPRTTQPRAVQPQTVGVLRKSR